MGTSFLTTFPHTFLGSSNATTNLQILAITRPKGIFIRFPSRVHFATLGSRIQPSSIMATPDYGVQAGMASALARLTGAQSESRKTDVEFIHLSNSAWPLSPSAGGNLTPAEWREREKRTIRISVLDSSFNPPTKAHLALASSSPPPSRKVLASPQAGSGDTTKVKSPSGNNMGVVNKQASEMPTYDARMLLLSVTNADKKLKHGDATYQQRLEMMALLSKEVQHTREIADPLSFNICVAAIDEPTFVGKSRKLRKAVARKLSSLSIGQHSSGSEVAASVDDSTIAEWEREITLFFVLGFDTVTRLFDPRFYGSIEAMRESLRSFFTPCEEGGDGSRVVCARRLLPTAKKVGNKLVLGESHIDQGQGLPLTSGMSEEEVHFFTSPEVKEYWESGKVLVMEDLSLDLQTISSTKARSSLADALGPDMEVRRLLPSSIANYVFQRGLYSQLQA